MSEYSNVEKPFLEQLAGLGWDVIDQGFGIPQEPDKSLRGSFREVVLKEVFKRSVSSINKTEDGVEWLTDKQLDGLLEELMDFGGVSLLETNKSILGLLFKHTVDVNEVTAEEFPEVKLIDFDEPERNHFIAINQFRIDTPGRIKDFIIPDIVLFVNGLPLGIIECKEESLFCANPMYEAITQLTRYSNQRTETAEAGLKEGDERLFWFNQMLIASCGDKAQFGTITSTDEYYYAWRDIWPEKYKEYNKPVGVEREQEVLIQGMLAKETMLDIVRNCTLFMDTGKKMVKVMCRYQQYRTVLKIVERLRKGKNADERSGVVWHTQGSGKSLTMVFAIRKLRMCDDLKDHKVVMVNDRNDLEIQLTATAALTGEKVNVVDSTKDLKKDLSGNESDLNMVMIHKFNDSDEKKTRQFIKNLIGKDGKRAEKVKKHKNFDMVNDSDRIIIMIDEAHRSQYSDLGDNLFAAFPHATKIAFTGTPLVTERHDKKTWERFGAYIDKYKLQDAVDDGATIQILYEGKTADTAINEKHDFDCKFENLFRERTPEEILAIKKKYGATGDILEAENRINAIAEDIVKHYIEDILPNGFKAQVVSSSKMAAVRYNKGIRAALQTYIAKEEEKDCPDEELLKKLRVIKTAVIVSSDGTNEKAEITAARKESKKLNAVEKFKEPFDFDDEDGEGDGGVAFLVVCDMLLTGFDAPIEQVMYIDKRIKEHNLLQAIARVNRVHKGKSRGFVVDYIGLSHNLRDALKIYSGKDVDDILASFKDVDSEVPILEQRYHRLLELFKDKGIDEIEAFVNQQIDDEGKEYWLLEDIIELLEDIKLRASFEVFLKKFLQSMDIILPHSAASDYRVPAKRFGYIFAKTKERYKDDSLNIKSAGAKVKKLINEHLVSLGINPKIAPVELLSPKFIEQMEKHKSKKAVASEMEHAIRKHCKINFQNDPAFYAKLSEKLEALIQKHKEDWDALQQELSGLRDEAIAGRDGAIEGITITHAPFYDLIGMNGFKDGEILDAHKETLKKLVRDVVDILRSKIDIINFWEQDFEVKKLKGELSDLIIFTGIDELINNSKKIVSEIMALAKNRHEEIINANL